jgi:hypothetical protein
MVKSLPGVLRTLVWLSDGSAVAKNYDLTVVSGKRERWKKFWSEGQATKGVNIYSDSRNPQYVSRKIQWMAKTIRCEWATDLSHS